MTKTQDLMKGNDYEAISNSLQETIGYSSALTEAENFGLSRDMRYAQLVAANQFEAMEDVLVTEKDLLQEIADNTENTVKVLVDSMKETSRDQSQVIRDLITQMQTDKEDAILKEEIKAEEKRLEIEANKASVLQTEAQNVQDLASKLSTIAPVGFGTDGISTTELEKQGFTSEQITAIYNKASELGIVGTKGNIKTTELYKISPELAKQSADLLAESSSILSQLEKDKAELEAKASAKESNIIPITDTVINTISSVVGAQTQAEADRLAAIQAEAQAKADIASKLESTSFKGSGGVAGAQLLTKKGFTTEQTAAILAEAATLGILNKQGQVKTKELETLINSLASMPSFAVGTPYVPYDMLANIHQGEAIIPKNFNDGIKSGDLTLGVGNNAIILELKALRKELEDIKSNTKNTSNNTKTSRFAS
jgi:hypothetical protein